MTRSRRVPLVGVSLASMAISLAPVAARAETASPPPAPAPAAELVTGTDSTLPLETVFPVTLPDTADTVGQASESHAEAKEPREGHAQQLSNLTLGNFFTEGWNQAWVHRHRYTPDMALLRVTTNFLERELRLDYVLTDVANNPNLQTTDLANGLMAYGLNRRLMLEVISNYQWNISPTGVTTSGAGGGFLTRFQLVDSSTQSYSFQARVSPPNKGIGQTQTSLTFAVAGWQDMHALLPALGRFGLYGSFQYEDLAGSHKPGATQNDISYDISFAETWTEPSTPVFGNLTTFLEFFGTTILSGSNAGKTTVSLTPGIRFWFVPKNSFTFGADLPLTSKPSFHWVFRATYIMNF